MDLRDIIVAPMVLGFVYVLAYFVRPHVTDDLNRRYFFPALSLKLFGAFALGMLYQFYYHGGDTYNFHTHGSRHIWNALFEDPGDVLRLLTNDLDPSIIYRYQKIYFLKDESSYFVIRMAAIIDFFTFSSYLGTAFIFAGMSFVGAWMLFLSFYKAYPHLRKPLAIATLFIPSVVFWGSGLLKDTVTLSCIGISTYIIRHMFSKSKVTIFNLLVLILTFYIVYEVKKYILLCFIPAAFIWAYMGFLSRFESFVFKVIMVPFVFVVSAICGYFVINQVGKDDPRYALDQLGKTAQVTAYDIAYQTGKDAGSIYEIGELDGTLGGMLIHAPQAINVSLFRPYLWEVRNPLMLLSAMESFLLFIATIFLVAYSGRFLGRGLINADVLFCFIFSITFAFAVGASTFNFGTLSRYKIPLLPFFAVGLIILNDYIKKEKAAKVEELQAV
jgi:hypothetical protein